MSKPNNPSAAKKPQQTGNNGGGSNFSSLLPYIVIPVAFVIAFAVWKYVMGAPSNFEGGDPEKGHPLNYFGTVFKGGPIVPILMTIMLTTLTFTIERFITVMSAKGKGSVDGFVRKIQAMLADGNVSSAIAECDKQKGSVANVVRAGLLKYAEMETNTELDKDAKLAAIKKEVEESTALELPMLEKNLVILSTVASVATLVALLGTVLGMIKSFQAMATSGAPDAVALSTGISEALINTALGIGTSAIAVIVYNFFTTQIDKLTYGIDEAGFTLEQTFAAKHNK
jgi:biopolymer transport protein ExbB